MSSNKYAGLPDIDSAPDIYETPDSFPTENEDKSDSSDDDTRHTRSGRRNIDETTSREDIDRSSLPNRDDVGKRFRKAEKRRGRFRDVYTYPISPTHSPSRSRSPSPSSRTKKPLNVRLESLRKQVESIEAELASAPGQQDVAGDADPTIMMRGLVEIRGRLDGLGSGVVGSEVGAAALHRALDSVKVDKSTTESQEIGATEGLAEVSAPIKQEPKDTSDARTLAEVDQRLGDLEKLVGASNAALDESTPMPQPLLPHITRLANQLTLLTQPRHIDSISRRLKLLLTDLERYSTTNARRQSSAVAPPNPNTSPTASNGPPSASLPQNDLAPILARLAPALPTIPHLLTRLRTLSTLHASASGFATALTDLEEEQKRTRAGLGELERAVKGVEQSLEVNAERVEGNLKGLGERLAAAQERLQAMGK